MVFSFAYKSRMFALNFAHKSQFLHIYQVDNDTWILGYFRRAVALEPLLVPFPAPLSLHSPQSSDFVGMNSSDSYSCILPKCSHAAGVE